MVLPEWHPPFHHFRRFRGSEDQNPLFLWVECKSSFSPFFVKTTCFRQRTKPPFPKTTVLTTLKTALTVPVSGCSPVPGPSCNQQFTYGVVSEGAFADHFSDILQNTCGNFQKCVLIGKFWMGSVQRGVGVKFPMFAVNCSRLPLSCRRTRGKRRKTKKKTRRKTKKSEEPPPKKRQKKRRKTKRYETKWDPTPSTPTPLRTSNLIASGKSAEISRKLSDNFCNDPFPNDPRSELLISCYQGCVS